jgi:hypothetical protein
MKARRWTSHALANLADREIDREAAERTIDTPDLTTRGHGLLDFCASSARNSEMSSSL